MSAYADPDTQMDTGPGPYVNQNGTPPSQQQQQHMTDPELRLQENLQQLRDGGDMAHPAGPQHTQYQQLAHMAPAMSAHPHFQTPLRPTHSPQQMAHAVMSLEGHHDAYDPSDPSRKRSKVSRACDECRRKKIRCDATSENGPEACSSCKRTGARCQFSRQPMKRGPSKGYIKELADRLNSLESQISQPQNPPQSYDFGNLGDPNFIDNQSQPPFKRQRTHSMTDTFHDTFGRPNWSSQDRELPLNGNRRTSFGEMTMAGSLIAGSNEEILKAYYNIIHPTLPILSHNESALNRLTNCPSKLREALFLALEACIRSFAAKALPPLDVDLNSLLHQSEAVVNAARSCLDDDDSSRLFYNRLVYCQSLILLAIATDRPGGSAEATTRSLLGQINGYLGSMRINDPQTLEMLKEKDQELCQTARRVFWTAFILDRFQALSRSVGLSLPLHVSKLSRDDLAALGEVGYYLARTADIISDIVNLNEKGLVSDTQWSFEEATSYQLAVLEKCLKALRESIELTSLTSNSPPYLAHQYLDLFVARLSSSKSLSVNILKITKKLQVNLVNSSITPLHHMFAAMVATSLTDLRDRVETQVEAQAGIKAMSDALDIGQFIYRSLDGLGWDTAIRDLLHQKKTDAPPPAAPDHTSPMSQPNMAGLQHLAAAAVGEREGADARPASSNGNGTPSQPAKNDYDLSAAEAAANEAAKAQATAAAAQQLSAATNDGNHFDSGSLKQDWS